MKIGDNSRFDFRYIALLPLLVAFAMLFALFLAGPFLVPFILDRLGPLGMMAYFVTAFALMRYNQSVYYLLVRVFCADEIALVKDHVVVEIETASTYDKFKLVVEDIGIVYPEGNRILMRTNAGKYDLTEELSQGRVVSAGSRAKLKAIEIALDPSEPAKVLKPIYAGWNPMVSANPLKCIDWFFATLNTWFLGNDFSIDTRMHRTRRKVPLKLIAISALVGLPLLAGCGQETVVRKISVSATAVKEMRADQLEMRLSIRNYASDNALAVAENSRSIARVLDLLKTHGSAVKDIQRFGTEFGRRDEYSQKVEKSESYHAETIVTFTVVDLGKHDAISLELASVPGVNISGASYSLADEIAQRSKVRQEAIRKAKDKAAEMATGVGMAIGDPLAVSEDPPAYSRSLPINSMSVDVAPVNTTGAITIESSVSIDFELIAD